MKWKKYKIEYAHSSRDDMRVIKKYILHKFKYREYAENFTKKMKAVAETLKTLPTGYDTTGFRYKGYEIYLKPYHTYQIFYAVDETTYTVTVLRVMQDGMNWKAILKQWLSENE